MTRWRVKCFANLLTVELHHWKCSVPWNKLCTDGAELNYGRNAELQTPVREKARHYLDTLLHRLTLASRNIIEELQTVFQDVITLVTCVKTVH